MSSGRRSLNRQSMETGEDTLKDIWQVRSGYVLHVWGVEFAVFHKYHRHRHIVQLSS